jgi:hypothetical protein
LSDFLGCLLIFISLILTIKDFQYPIKQNKHEKLSKNKQVAALHCCGCVRCHAGI